MTNPHSNGRIPASKRKPGHVRVFRVRLDSIHPSPENDALYREIDWEDPDIQALAKDIKNRGLLEPIVITADRYIVSGHRRRVAAYLARLKTVPCRVLRVKREGNPNFVTLLREFNRQRVKSRDEQLREEIVSANPEDSYRELQEFREAASAVKAETFEIRGEKHRHQISAAKEPFLNAVREIIARLKPFWPLSDRQIHYQLLNAPPLIHAKKPESIYRNNRTSYRALTELVTQARHEGKIPFEVIHDPTRPESIWRVHQNVALYYREVINGLLKGYFRNLLQSQPNHIEIVAEKNTVQSILEPIASHYCIPLTISRGYCSTAPRYAIAERFRNSGKKNLVVLVASDFDPDGEEIAHSLVRSLRDDFYIRDVEPVKVALTFDQVQTLNLPEGLLRAKPSSPNYKRFVNRYGDAVYELEAVPPVELQAMLRKAIEATLDMSAFLAEVEAEKKDAAHLSAVRRRIITTLQQAGEISGESPE